MSTKTPVKKAKKTSRKTKGMQTSGMKPVRKVRKKTPKKITLDDLLKSQNEAWAAIRETQAAVKKPHNDIFGLNKAKEEAWAAIRETQKNIGGLNNTLGSLVEHIMTPDLPHKFKQFGFSFNRITTIKYAEGVYAEIDGLIENGTQAIVVEVKTTLRQADIDDHILRMEKVRKHADEYNDKRQFMGAIAATITDKSTREYALKKGLFVIEPSGEDVKVTKPMVEPRVW